MLSSWGWATAGSAGPFGALVVSVLGVQPAVHRAAGLKITDPYSMRHTFASLMDYAGEIHQTIADMMGLLAAACLVLDSALWFAIAVV